MKNLIFIFLLFFTSAIAQAQEVGIIVVPTAYAYSKANLSGTTVALLLEADMFSAEIHKPVKDKNAKEYDSYDYDDEYNYCYRITLANGKKAYVSKEDMAIVEAGATAQKIKIADIEYLLMSAEQVDEGVEMATHWPFFLNPQTRKAHFIRSVLSANEDSHIFNHNFCQYCATLTNVSIQENLLHIQNNYTPSPESISSRENNEIISHHYFEIKINYTGQFWAIHNRDKKNNSLWLDTEFLFSVKNETDPNNDISFQTPILKDTKTKKSYYIYADPKQPLSENAADLFNASKRLTIAIPEGEGFEHYFIIEGSQLLIYADYSVMGDVPYTAENPAYIVFIYSFTLHLENGKIIATENEKPRLSLGLKANE